MASPYALDFSPVTNALDANRQYGLSLRQQEMARNRLAMEQERLGFERELHPLTVQQRREAIAGAAQLHPLEIRAKRAGVESAEDTLAATRSLRTDLGGAVATPGVARTVGGDAGAQSPPAWQPEFAKRAAGMVRQHVLEWPDPITAQKNYEALIAHPQLAAAFQKSGYVGPDWKGNAQRFVQDMEREAGGPMGPVNPASPTAPAPAAAAPAGAADLAQAAAVARGDAPITNLAEEFNRARRMIASGVPAFVSAGETHMKFVQSMMEKGQLLTRSGGVAPIPGAAEAQARAAGLKQQAEKVGEGAAAAQVNLPTALSAGNMLIRNIDAVLAAKGLDNVVGVTAGHPWTPTIRQSSADVEALLKPIEGGIFMQAYQSLKGGGAISDVEGAKAAASISALNDRRMSPPAYRAALKETKADIQDLMLLAQAKAQGQGPQEAARIGVLQEARAAVAKGADPAKVGERLRQNGIDPGRL